jgi:hypothetical protein
MMVRHAAAESLGNVMVRLCEPYERPGLPRGGGGAAPPRSDGELCWVAQSDGVLLGRVRLVRDADYSARVKELSICVDDDRDALTAVLLHAVITHCRRVACVRIVLDAGVDTDLAVAIFSAHGFQWHRRRGALAFYVNLYCDPDRPRHREDRRWTPRGAVWVRRPRIAAGGR